MAFPGTYNISYYKGDTYEFRVYPKTADGSVFDLTPYIGGGSYDDDNDPLTPNVPYDNVMFVCAESRGSADWHKCAAWISNDKTYVGCAIRGGLDGDSQYLNAGTTYVYDVQVTRPSNNATDGNPFDYPVIHTLLTGTITVTGQVTP
jgi:hypothetical protein